MQEKTRAMTGFTFPVHDVQNRFEEFMNTDWQSGTMDLKDRIGKITKFKSIEAVSPSTRPLLRSVDYHSLVGAAVTAFDNHLALTIQPDDVWISILQGLATHIKENAERLRKTFVEHEDKKKLTYRDDSLVLGNPENNWESVFAGFGHLLRLEIGEKNHNMFVKEFSTTNYMHTAGMQISLMNAMQEYFEFCVMTCCGVPEVTIEGTVDDWKRITEGVATIGEMDPEFTWWTDVIGEHCKQFEKAAEGNPDSEWWNSYVSVEGGSGGPFIAGHVIDFIPYVGKTKKIRNHYVGKDHSQRGFFYGMNPIEIPKAVSSVPVQWLYRDKEFNLEFGGGLVGVSIDEERKGVRCEPAWFIIHSLD